MRCWCVSGWSILARRFAAAVVLFAALTSVTGMPAASAAETNRCGLQPGHNPAIHVGAVLVVASPISKTAITAMQAEVERIWSRHGVKLGWLAPDHVRPDSGANVDVLLVPDSRECGRVRPSGRKTLGCFRFRDGDSRPLITIFPQHAQQLAGALSARICGRRCLEGWIRAVTRHTPWSGARPRDRPLPARTGAQWRRIDARRIPSPGCAGG